MKPFDPGSLLEVWERGARASSTERALLFLTACAPEHGPEGWLRASIGRRDAALLDAYAALFGPKVRCTASCKHCGEVLEVCFDVADVRVGFDRDGGSHSFETEGHALTLRSTCSADLLCVQHLSPEEAERVLLDRCVLEAHTPAGPVHARALPDSVVQALTAYMARVDAQAEVVFSLECAACHEVHVHPFDIATHLWAQFDRWARALLAEVHLLARVYHWSEASILGMTRSRRGAYLTLLGAN